MRKHALEFLGVDLEPGLAEKSFLLADARLPFADILKLALFYRSIAMGCIRDGDALAGDKYFILKRLASRLAKGLYRSFTGSGLGLSVYGARVKEAK